MVYPWTAWPIELLTILLLSSFSSLGRSTSSVPHFIISAFWIGVGSIPSPMARIVLLLPSSILAFLGVLHLVSSTILIGFLAELYFGLTVSEGLSSIMVPIPTNMASYLLLRRCTLSKSSLFDSSNRCHFNPTFRDPGFVYHHALAGDQRQHHEFRRHRHRYRCYG